MIEVIEYRKNNSEEVMNKLRELGFCLKVDNRGNIDIFADDKYSCMFSSIMPGWGIVISYSYRDNELVKYIDENLKVSQLIDRDLRFLNTDKGNCWEMRYTLKGRGRE